MQRFVGPPVFRSVVRCMAVFGVASLLGQAPAALGAPGLRTYHDVANGYTIQYAPSIAFTETHSSQDEWHMKSDNPDAYFELGLKITTTKKTEAKDVGQDMSWKISQSAKSVSKVVPVSLVPGMVAYSFRTSENAVAPDGRTVAVDEEGSEYVVLDGKGHAYMFAALTYPDQFHAQKQRWEKVIASFRFDR